MGCGSAEFVRNKLSRPCLAKRNGFADSFDAFNDLTFLTRRLRYSQFREPVEAIYAIFIDPPSDKAGQAILERCAARNHYPSPFCLEPLKILHIPVEERVLIIPFEFESKSVPLAMERSKIRT